jgi:hypothetical protein
LTVPGLCSLVLLTKVVSRPKKRVQCIGGIMLRHANRTTERKTSPNATLPATYHTRVRPWIKTRASAAKTRILTAWTTAGL